MQTLKTKIKMLVSLMLLLGVFLSPKIAMAADCQTSATPDGNNPASQQEIQKCLKDNKIVQDLNTFINFLSAGVGIIIIVMIIIGGIQYSTAGGSSDATTKAKNKIINALIALFAYLLLYAFVQWLVPGGVFG